MITYSIIQKSQLEGALRLDAEYYQPEYLNLISKIKGQKSKLLKDFLKLLYRYPTFYNLQYHKEGVLILKGEDILPEGFIQNQSQDYISEEDTRRFPKTILKEGDLIFSVRGYVGKVGLVDKKYEGSIISANLIRAVIKDISPYFLWVYLNSKYGIKQIDRAKMITAQETILADDIKKFLVPELNKEKQIEIENLAKQAINKLRKSESLYSQAENLLLEELGLKDFKPKEDLSYIVNLSEIKSAHRADAEYFQPKYEKLVEKIKKYGLAPLLDLVQNVPARFNPKSQPTKLFRYVELSNITSSVGTVDGFSEVSGNEAPSRAKRVLKANDVIFSSVEGSLGKVALVGKEQEGYLASNGFFQFRTKDILPEVLLVLAKSFVLQMQFERETAGTILTAVPKEAVKNIIVPRIEKSIQQKIANLVQKSHEARKKAKKLLEEAKRKVEEEIKKKHLNKNYCKNLQKAKELLKQKSQNKKAKN